MSMKKETPGRSSGIVYDEYSNEQEEMIEEEDFYNDFENQVATKNPTVSKQKTSTQIDETKLVHMNDAQLKNFTRLNEQRVLSESGQIKHEPIEKKKLKSEYNNPREDSSKSPGGVFIGSKTISSNHETKKHPPTTSGRKKTPAVIVQHDIYSYDILNGNQSNNSINMININNDPDPEEEEEEEEESKLPSSNSKGTLKTANRNPMSPDSESKSKAMKTPLDQVDDVSEKTEMQPDLSLEKMNEINQSLKMELQSVLSQMEQQVQKIQEKRRLKHAKELQMLTMLDQKNAKLTKGQRKFLQLKKEIADMYSTLEHNYNITQITTMEDELTAKTTQLKELRDETKTQQGIVDKKKIILDEINKVSENQDKINTLSTMIGSATIQYKKMRIMSLEDQKQVKQGHEQVLRMQENCKKVAGIIKDQKQKQSQIIKDGGTLMTQDEINEEIKEQNKKEAKLIAEMQKLEKINEKNFKNEEKMLDKQISVAKHENQVLNVKLKEKDQEIKLNDLKIKELKKQVPNTRLRPLKGKRRTVDHGSENYMPAGGSLSQSGKPRYDAQSSIEGGIPPKKRLNPLASSHPISQTPNNKNTVMRRKYEAIPKALPRDKSQAVETMPKLAERSQRSRQRARMGIKSDVDSKFGLKSPKKTVKGTGDFITPKVSLNQSTLTGAITRENSNNQYSYGMLSPKGPMKVKMGTDMMVKPAIVEQAQKLNLNQNIDMKYEPKPVAEIPKHLKEIREEQQSYNEPMQVPLLNSYNSSQNIPKYELPLDETNKTLNIDIPNEQASLPIRQVDELNI